jgi:predicted ATP-grasp superfamily ATP-dependent carboligase
MDKLYTYQRAQALQIPIPHTLAPQTLTDVRRMQHEITYPCLLKPRMSHQFWPHFRVKLLRIHSPTELLHRYQAYPTIPWLIQEEIPGPADRIFTLRACLNNDAEPLGVHVTQKLRQWPPTFGIGSYAQSVWDPTVVALGLRILQHLGFYGIASVEFKRDDRTNTLKLIEINGRSGTMTYLSTLCGVNTPYLAYQEAVGANPAPVDPTQCHYEVGRTWVHLQLDALSVTHNSSPFAITWMRWLRALLHRPQCYAIFAWNDPQPFLSEIKRALTRNARSTRATRQPTPQHL